MLEGAFAAPHGRAGVMVLPSANGAVLRPRDAADVGEVLSSQAGPFELVGGGTNRAIGNPVDAQTLDVSALDGILSYEPAELVLSACAATPLAVLERELAAQGQRLAFEPPDFGALLSGCAAPQGRAAAAAAQGEESLRRGTLGGALAANLSGSRRIGAGAARDHFLGFSAVSGDGRPFKAGGKVVKNVTGYDLPKLLAGSWGTLAVLTEVTVRVAPAPETETTLLVQVEAVERAVALLSDALKSPHEVSCAAYDDECRAALRVEGFEASVAARVRGLAGAFEPRHGANGVALLEASDSRAYWQRLGSAAALAPWPVVWRISVPPGDAPRVLAAIRPRSCVLDWGGGLIWAGYDEVDAARVRGALGGGHATLWKAPAQARRAVPVFEPQTAGVEALAARVKAAFDPDDKLNPGRLAVSVVRSPCD